VGMLPMLKISLGRFKDGERFPPFFIPRMLPKYNLFPKPSRLFPLRESAYIRIMVITRIFEFFENWIKPFARKDDLRPPESTFAFIWFYISQAKAPFFAMLVLGGLTAAIEAALFWFVGRLVDILSTVKPEEGWAGLLAAHGGELVGMLVLIGVVRFIVTMVTALVDQQIITPGFYNLVRWQSYMHVARQSLTFFQNDFSGRIVTKVWSGGQAAGDLVTSLMESVWFVGIYSWTGGLRSSSSSGWGYSRCWRAISCRASATIPRKRRKPPRCSPAAWWMPIAISRRSGCSGEMMPMTATCGRVSTFSSMRP
jgi:ATP-binding cassette, subfamily B, multidrug efflux pump